MIELNVVVSYWICGIKYVLYTAFTEFCFISSIGLTGCDRNYGALNTSTSLSKNQNRKALYITTATLIF